MIVNTEVKKETELPEVWNNDGKVGKGVFGTVYRVVHKKTQQVCAIKVMNITQSEYGVPVEILREIVILRRLSHPNIIEIVDVIMTNEKMFLVVEYMNSDLNKYIQSFGDESIPVEKIKNIMKQILMGLEYLNIEGILHRDLTPRNILINIKENEELEVKLADFGLSRTYTCLSQRMTKEVVTPLYRAPEIFLGSFSEYSTYIDIWSAGCIFAELVTKIPLFLANTETEVIIKMLRMYGVKSLVGKQLNYAELDCTLNNLSELVPGLDSNGIDLLTKMLNLDPSKRITAKEALEHEFFK